MSNRYDYYPQGIQGYSPEQGNEKGYAQAPAQGSAAPFGNAYSVPAGQQAPPYTIPAQQGSGSFIPQTPYSPGYTSPGYQPPAGSYSQPAGYPAQGGYQAPAGGYPQQSNYSVPQNGYQIPAGGYSQSGYMPPQGRYMQGEYNPYGQMGKTPQQPQNGYGNAIPLNGGGYVPQRVPVRKRAFVLKDWHLVAAGVILIALFVFSVLVLKNIPLKIALILLALGSAAVLWIKPLTAENKRLTYSILALALCLLTAVSFLIHAPNDVTRTGTKADQNSGNGSVGETENIGVPEIPANNGGTGQDSLAEEISARELADNLLREKVISFFNSWSQNRQDEMLALCAPSWQEKQESPRTSLFALLANRIPKDCNVGEITGTEADNSRRVTVTSTIDRNYGKTNVYKLSILMVKENNEWYIDPQSLQSNEIQETPDPNVTPTTAPTETPAVYSNTVLYYNPNKGEYYHLDPNCKTANPKFLPFAGQFYYSQINDEPYSSLKPCNVCGAPLRP